MDVHFVWHCHMLSPLHYHADLEKSPLARAIDHIPSCPSELEEKRERTRLLWMSMFPHEPFDPAPPHAHGGPTPPKVAEDETPAFTYDIEKAAARQKVFYYQVSPGIITCGHPPLISFKVPFIGFSATLPEEIVPLGVHRAVRAVPAREEEGARAVLSAML